MPGFNGTGPNGMGPMSGRAMGYCAGNAVSTRSFRGRGGCGFGMGAGRRVGFQVPVNAGFTTGFDSTTEKQVLVNRISGLQAELQAMQARLNELEKSDS